MSIFLSEPSIIITDQSEPSFMLVDQSVLYFMQSDKSQVGGSHSRQHQRGQAAHQTRDLSLQRRGDRHLPRHRL